MNGINFSSNHFSKINKWVFFTFFIVVHIFILRNVFYFGKDMLYGDGSVINLIPQPRYELLRIPDTDLAIRYGAENRLGADFSSLYFPAQQMDILEKHYENGNLDPWNRPSNKAPLLYYFCSISFCRLSYAPASLSAMFFQYLLFMAVYIFSFKILKIEKNVGVGLLLANSYLFLTPTGLSWLERGQSYLFVGGAYLLLLTSLLKRNNYVILLSAPLVFVRWTSLPLSVLCFAIYLFNSKNMSEARRKVFIGAGFSLIFSALTFVFPSLVLLYLKQLFFSESQPPGGISLETILPFQAKYILPLLLVILGMILAKINKRVFEESIPFLAGSAIILLTYPTVPYEYSLASVLGFIPLLLYWAKQPGPSSLVYAGKLPLYLLLGFMACASFSRILVNQEYVIYEYLLAAFILFIFQVFYSWKIGQNPELAQQGAGF